MPAGSKLLPSQRAKLSRGEVHIIEERCKECGLCIDFCPVGVLRTSNKVNEKGYHLPELAEEPDKGKICVACGFCQAVCPEYGIWVEKREE